MAPTELGQRLTDVELPTLSYTEAKPLDLLADTSADDACQDKDGILREQDLEDHTLYLPNKQLIFLVATIALSYCLAVMEQSMLASALPSIASRTALSSNQRPKLMQISRRFPRWKRKCLGGAQLPHWSCCWSDVLRTSLVNPLYFNRKGHDLIMI